MSDPIALLLSAVAGLGLGMFFFGGLWWTIRRGMASRLPALWFFSSLLIRLLAVFAGLYWIGKDDWKRLVACLIGFTIARFVVTSLTHPSDGIGKETRDAP